MPSLPLLTDPALQFSQVPNFYQGATQVTGLIVFVSQDCGPHNSQLRIRDASKDSKVDLNLPITLDFFAMRRKINICIPNLNAIAVQGGTLVSGILGMSKMDWIVPESYS